MLKAVLLMCSGYWAYYYSSCIHIISFKLINVIYIYIYIYIYMCVCVCVCVCIISFKRIRVGLKSGRKSSPV